MAFMGVVKGGGVLGPPNPPVIIVFIKDGVVCSTVRSVLYAVRFYTHQRWSHRGHGLSLEDPRGQLTMTLVLGFKSSFLALDCQSLALASDYQSLALALGYQSLALPLASDCQSFPYRNTPWVTH